MSNLSNANPPEVLALSTAALNQRAAVAVKVILDSGVSLRDHEGLAYEAATLACPHLAHVEALETAAKRGGRVLLGRALRG